MLCVQNEMVLKSIVELLRTRLTDGRIVPYHNTSKDGRIKPPGQNGSQFAGDIFGCIFVNEWFCMFIKLFGAKPSSEPMPTRFTEAYMRRLGEMRLSDYVADWSCHDDSPHLSAKSLRWPVEFLSLETNSKWTLSWMGNFTTTDSTSEYEWACKPIIFS